MTEPCLIRCRKKPELLSKNVLRIFEGEQSMHTEEG